MQAVRRALAGHSQATLATLMRTHPELKASVQMGELLGAAAQRGDGATITMLVSAGLPPDVRVNGEGDTALFAAIAERSQLAVNTLIELEADVNVCDYRGITPLYFAATSNNMLAAARLLRAGALPHVLVAGIAAIHAAISVGHEHIAHLLFRNGCKETEDDEGSTPLQTAIRRGHVELAKKFIAEGADVTHVDDIGCSILGDASASASPELVKIVLAAGASPQRRLPGPTPLGLACETLSRSKDSRPVLEIITALLDAGADVNEASISQTTPLLIAVSIGSLAAVSLLVERHADLGKRGDAGAFGFGVAAAAGHVDVMRFLLSRGADIRQRDSGGNLATHMAARHGQVESLRFLMKQGQGLLDENKNGALPLALALYSNNLDVCAAILKCIDVEAPLGAWKATPLHLALTVNTSAVPLVAAAATPEQMSHMLAASSASGMSAYHAAAIEGDSEALKLLLPLDSPDSIRANVSRSTYHGLAPIDFAISHGSEKNVKLLLEHTEDAYFEGGFIDALVAHKLALRALEKHARQVMMIVCRAGEVESIRVLYPRLRSHFPNEATSHDGSVLHWVVESQNAHAVRVLVDMLSNRQAQSMAIIKDRHGRLPGDIALASSLRLYVKRLTLGGHADRQARVHRDTSSAASREVDVLWSRWNDDFGDMDEGHFPQIEKLTESFLSYLKGIRRLPWYRAANPEVRKRIDGVSADVSTRVAERLDRAFQKRGVGWGMGHHYGAHSPTITLEQLRSRLGTAEILGSSRFDKSGMMALLEVRGRVVEHLNVLEYQLPGRYLVDCHHATLSGQGFERTAALSADGASHFVNTKYARAVLERRQDGSSVLVSLFPITAQQARHPLDTCQQVGEITTRGRDEHAA